MLSNETRVQVSDIQLYTWKCVIFHRMHSFQIVCVLSLKGVFTTLHYLNEYALDIIICLLEGFQEMREIS